MTQTPDDAPAPETFPETAPAASSQGGPGRWLTHRWTAPGLAVVALAAAIIPNLPGVFEGRVRAYLLDQPQMLEEIQLAASRKVQDQRIATLNQAAAANPAVFEPHAGEPVFGPADARVTVIEYFDYRCPYCKMVAPSFLKLVQDHPEVRFIFREWPILDREGEIASQYAARAALAAHAQGRYLPVHQALMAERALTVESIDRILAEHGVVVGAENQALQTPDVARVLANVHTGALTIGLDATPTIFVNGRALSSNDPNDLVRVIAAAR